MNILNVMIATIVALLPQNPPYYWNSKQCFDITFYHMQCVPEEFDAYEALAQSNAAIIDYALQVKESSEAYLKAEAEYDKATAPLQAAFGYTTLPYDIYKGSVDLVKDAWDGVVELFKYAMHIFDPNYSFIEDIKKVYNNIVEYFNPSNYQHDCK
jgi:hypothetical protein